MGPASRISTAQWIFERQLAWIAAAEIKVGLVVTLDVGMLGGLAAAFSTVQTKGAWLYVFAVSAATLAVVALACAAYSVMPRLDGPPKSLLFFGRIVKVPLADYVEHLRVATDTEILADWSEQIHRNAQIADLKHRWVARAMAWSFMSAIPWVAAICLMVR